MCVNAQNCTMMASESPLDPPDTPKALLIEQLAFIFNIIFTIEMTLKITAFGLLSYLSEGWNLLDVTVVTTAWAPLIFPNVGNYSAIRAVRVLRALRTVKRIPSLKRIIETLLKAIPEVRACHISQAPAQRGARASHVSAPDHTPA